MLAWELSHEVSKLLINTSSSQAAVPEVLRSSKMKEKEPLFVFLICSQEGILVIGRFSGRGREEARGCTGLGVGY